jgi:BirA family biotin operon repressor/biotin-[acetyl-CoA-carboxylase] ligase
MPAEPGGAIDQPWTDLAAILGEHLPGRNRMAARLIAALVSALEDYGRFGLGPFLADWDAFDGLRGEAVRLLLGGRMIEGIHVGIAPDGALRLATAEGVQSYHAGEVSLRPAEAPTP